MNNLAETFRRLPNAPYLLIGSGFSRRYCDNAPNWRELLIDLAKVTRPDKPHPLRSYEQELEPGLTVNQSYARVASKIESDYNNLFFSGGIPITDEHLEVDYETHPELNPFRVHLAHLMRNTRKRIELPQELQDELSDLRVAAKHCINGIITTNFDDFVESVFPDFDVYRAQDDLIVTQATGFAEIYKIHGDYHTPESMVFTEKDYAGFEKRKAYLVSKLLSIFVENPVIILGYSLSDDNILGIFESIAGCLSSEHLKELGKRVVYVAYDREIEEPEVSIWKPMAQYQDFFITTVKTNSFAPIFKQIIKLRRRYPLHLLRRIRQDVYRTVVSNEPQDTIKVLPQHVVMDEDSGNIVTVVGFAREGGGEHIALSTEEVYQHIIQPDDSINYRSFVTDWLPKKIEGTKYPVYYFIRKYLEQSGGVATLPECVITYLQSIAHIDSFLNHTMVSDWKPHRSVSSIRQIEENWENEKNKLNKLALLDEEELNNGQLLKVLHRIMQEEPEIFSSKRASEFRRLIRICDYVENAKAILLSEDGTEASLRVEAMSPAEKARPEERSIPEQAPSVHEN